MVSVVRGLSICSVKDLIVHLVFTPLLSVVEPGLQPCGKELHQNRQLREALSQLPPQLLLKCNQSTVVFH